MTRSPHTNTSNPSAHEALKPCPFCGGDAALTEYWPNKSTAFCLNADCPMDDGWAYTGAEAVAAWNTRAHEARLEGERGDELPYRLTRKEFGNAVAKLLFSSSPPIGKYELFADTLKRAVDCAYKVHAEATEQQPIIPQPAPHVGDGQPDELVHLRQQIEDWHAMNANLKRLVRELDVALNGEDGAAPQASLCGIVSQVKAMKREPAALQAGSAPKDAALAVLEANP